MRRNFFFVCIALLWFGSASAVDLNKAFMDRLVKAELQASVFNAARTQSLIDWQVGDKSEYVVQVFGTIELARMHKEVLSRDNNFLVYQMNVTGMAQQEIRSKINVHTGEEVERYVDGKRQELGPPPEVEIIDQGEGGKIVVPAGTFETVFVELEVEEKGQKRRMKVWLNPRDVALEGTVQVKMKQQGMDVFMKLVSQHFKSK